MEEKLAWLKDFVAYTLHRFDHDRCPSVAAQLTVTTLLSLVPLLTVVFALFSLFPQFSSLRDGLEAAIFSNLMPESGVALQDYLNQYVKNTEGLTTIGTIFLVVTSLMLMRTIDQSFNRIWQVRGLSSPVRTFLVYWAVLTLGPLLLSVSLGVSSYFASLPLLSDVVGTGNSISSRIIPFVLTMVAFLVMFIAVPNRPVKFKYGAIAALVTTILFETAKFGFGLFVKQFSTYQLIFGALASVPLFVIWIQLSWMIILVGVEIAHALATFEQKSQSRLNHPFIVAARIIKLLITCQRNRQVVTLDYLKQQLTEVSSDRINAVISSFEEAELVVVKEGDVILLTGDSDAYKLSDIIVAGIDQIPDARAIEELKATDSALAEAIEQARSVLVAKLSGPLEV